jgi:hypothetical protein
MTNSLASAPSPVHSLRPQPTASLFDLFRPAQRRQTEGLPLVPSDSAWDALSLVCNQQLSQDALLMWHYDRRHERFRLCACSPSQPWNQDLVLGTNEQLSQLASQRLEAVAHVHCALSDCPLERALWDLGLHAGLTTVMSEDEDEAYLLTFGFRERWQLVAHHTSTVVAVTAYLREVQKAVLPAPAQKRWWELVSLVPHLCRQPYRPSVMRTVYDLNEILSDVMERCRPTVAEDSVRLSAKIARLAHRGADLMARLESVYWDSRPMVSTEEYLSEAVLLVRGAYQICLGDWSGCMAAASTSPDTEASNPSALRHALVDWVLDRMNGEQAAA